MKYKKKWIDLSFISLITVALLGFILRSKILFSLPMIDYNRLLDAHAHFAFGGWITLALLVLMIYEILPESFHRRPIYHWLFGCIVMCSWGMLFSFYFIGNGFLSNTLSTLFIVITYVFGYFYIKDIRRSKVSKTVLLLSLVSIASLLLSSSGPLMLICLFAIKSLDAILYRDALFTYLHLQYNGFFTLAVFALLFNRLESQISSEARQTINRFSVLLCISIVPSLFLSFLWHDPNHIIQFIAIVGSLLLLLSFIWFIISAKPILKISRAVPPFLWCIGSLSMFAFALKIVLQSLTIFPAVGDVVFGDRPAIIGFLHLVFLGFVSLFILVYYGQTKLLNSKKPITKIALSVFVFGVVLNEVLLMVQGLGVMLIKSSAVLPFLLWVVAICLFSGTILLGIARIQTNTLSRGDVEQ